MMKNLLQERNPLYGRFAASLKLDELNYLDTSKFYPDKSAYDKVAHYAVFGGSPLTVCPGCAISPASGGGISSRAASFPMTGKGRGIGLNINGGLLMNFTNSPYERMMKEIPHKDIPAPQKAPEGTPCAGCPYWREIACVFCYQERLKKQS
jgi:hypothetical protein